MWIVEHWCTTYKDKSTLLSYHIRLTPTIHITYTVIPPTYHLLTINEK
jgi:alkanesulfonate monooxygenase SsuD/methylene tetrahydromethanopterin reductase-like flavin-dependent oxidoreductase (luciferase family)